MELKRKFRNFQTSDYDLLISLWEAAGLPYKPRGRDSYEKMSEEILRADNEIILCEVEDRLVGCILLTHDRRKGWLNRLAVHPDFRRCGIASQLIKEAEKRLINKGLGIITCLIEEDNPDSRKMFIEQGYVEHKEIIYYSKRIYNDV